MLPRTLLLPALGLALALFSAGCSAEGVGQGHFRYATIFWRKTDDASSNTVEATASSASAHATQLGARSLC